MRSEAKVKLQTTSITPHSAPSAEEPGADIRQATRNPLSTGHTPDDAGAHEDLKPNKRTPRQDIPAAKCGSITKPFTPQEPHLADSQAVVDDQGKNALSGMPNSKKGDSPAGQMASDHHMKLACQKPAAIEALKPNAPLPQPGEAEVHALRETSARHDLRFTDPLIAQIVETWRIRQDMVRAQQKLTLQIKAICRRYTGGDKKEADKLYSAMEKGTNHPMAESCHMACMALFAARIPLEDQRAAYEKTLAKLGKRLPIAHMADQIKGVGHLALAKIVGECGDLSAYKSVSAVWKRAGLAVINGERQRRKSDAELALLHGYSPDRRSTFWNVADPLLKAQGKDENAGPYRQFYDVEKTRQIEEKECSKAQAHNRAMRHMTKKLLKDLTVEWRRVENLPGAIQATKTIVPSPSEDLIEDIAD